MGEVPSTPVIELSTKPPTTNELSIMESGKTGSQESDMEAPVSPTNVHKSLAELIGTYFLILLGCGAILVDQIHPITIIGVALVWGLLVMVLIYSLGHISGAHVNPAVTIAFAVSRKLPWKQVPMYVASQLTASLLASLTLYALFKGQVSMSVTHNQVSAQTGLLQAFTWEFMATFILMFAVWGVAVEQRAINELSGVAVGAVIVLDVIVIGPITGASMNPARSIGPAVVSGKFHDLWLFILAPIFGATAAPLIHNLMSLPMPDKSDKEEDTESQ